MAYIDEQGYLRYTAEEEETMKEVGSHFTPKGYKHSAWVTDTLKWLYGDLPISENKND